MLPCFFSFLKIINIDGFVKSPISALRFIYVVIATYAQYASSHAIRDEKLSFQYPK